MCKEKLSAKCCIDNLLLILVILFFMLFYMYLVTKNEGIISIMIILSVFSFIICTIRLEDYGCPDFIKHLSNICKDRLVHDEEYDNENN